MFKRFKDPKDESIWGKGGKPWWELKLKDSRKILRKESMLMLQGILVSTHFLLLKIKKFKDPKDESIWGKDGKSRWERRLKVSRKILNKESKLILEGIRLRTLCLFYKFMRFKDPKDESIWKKYGKPPWETRLKVSRKILYKESNRILHGILLRTLCLFYTFKRFKYPKDESIWGKWWKTSMEKEA